MSLASVPVVFNCKKPYMRNSKYRETHEHKLLAFDLWISGSHLRLWGYNVLMRGVQRETHRHWDGGVVLESMLCWYSKESKHRKTCVKRGYDCGFTVPHCWGRTATVARWMGRSLHPLQTLQGTAYLRDNTGSKVKNIFDFESTCICKAVYFGKMQNVYLPMPKV